MSTSARRPPGMPGLDVDRAYAVLDHADRFGCLDQSRWIDRAPDGTETMCFATLTCVLHGDEVVRVSPMEVAVRPVEGGPLVSPDERAMLLLGLNGAQAAVLFVGARTGEVPAIVRRLFGPRWSAMAA